MSMISSAYAADDKFGLRVLLNMDYINTHKISIINSATYIIHIYIYKGFIHYAVLKCT